MVLWQEGRGQGKEEGAQPSFALGGTVSSVGEFPQHLLSPRFYFWPIISLKPEVTLCPEQLLPPMTPVTP